MNEAEILARRAIEDNTKCVVHNANVVLQSNCPNIDLIVYCATAPKYVQVKSSTKPAGKGRVVVSGSPFTHDQLFNGGPIFNKHNGYRAHVVVIVHQGREFYVAPPDELEEMLKANGRNLALKPKRDGSKRSLGFRGELSKAALTKYRDAWHLLGS